MTPRITVITLGVNDVEAAYRFYTEVLGFASKGLLGKDSPEGAVAFFDLQGGMKLAIWSRRSIAHDAGVPVSPRCPGDFTLGHNVESREEVDAILEAARAGGATITKPAQPTFYGGYAGYFQDPDGHLWEIVWNPGFDSL